MSKFPHSIFGAERTALALRPAQTGKNTASRLPPRKAFPRTPITS